MIIENNAIPTAVTSDDINDTTCYKKIIDEVHRFASEKQFSLVEKFCYELYSVIKKMVGDNRLKLCITKYPEIENFSGSISFEIDEGVYE